MTPLTSLSEAKRILVIEDDLSLSEWICDYLSSNGYDVMFTHTGANAVELILSENPDLVLLDIMLPVKDGFDICREVRSEYLRPILMMTARDEELDEVLGLEMGANDYVTKPIRPRALLARVKKLLKKEGQSETDNLAQVAPSYSEDVIEYGRLRIDKISRSTLFDGEAVPISSNEFDVLWVLASHAGEVMSREQLVTQIRGIEYDGFDRSMDMLISRIRKKLNDDATTPFRIKTVWGKGYLFAKDAW